jgi:hypothetical protein
MRWLPRRCACSLLSGAGSIQHTATPGPRGPLHLRNPPLNSYSKGLPVSDNSRTKGRHRQYLRLSFIRQQHSSRTRLRSYHFHSDQLAGGYRLPDQSGVHLRF